MAGIVIRSLTTQPRDRRSLPAPAGSVGTRAQPLPTRPDARDPGDSSGEAIPVPIPNTEVKLSSAEDTERAAFRENRSSPGFLRFLREPFRDVPDRILRDAGYPSRPMTSTSVPATPTTTDAVPDDGRHLPVPARGRRRLARLHADPRASLHGGRPGCRPRARQAAAALPRRRARHVRDVSRRDRRIAVRRAWWARPRPGVPGPIATVTTHHQDRAARPGPWTDERVDAAAARRAQRRPVRPHRAHGARVRRDRARAPVHDAGAGGDGGSVVGAQATSSPTAGATAGPDRSAGGRHDGTTADAGPRRRSSPRPRPSPRRPRRPRRLRRPQRSSRRPTRSRAATR